MTDDTNGPKIIVDSDWKEEAAREKADLDEKTKAVGSGGDLPEPDFAEIINMIVMQAAVSIGGYRSPTGESVPADLRVAKHFIDLLEILRKKTEGNLTEEEAKVFDTVLYEMRMRFVSAAQPAGSSPIPEQPPNAPPTE